MGAIYPARFPSLELHAFRKRDLWLRSPDVWWAPECEYEIEASGFYHKPERKEVVILGRFVDLSRGVIVLADVDTIAHEWRHHWQLVMWGDDFCHQETSDWNAGISTDNYQAAIVEYFENSVIEHDALVYELTYQPSQRAKEWYEWIETTNKGET